MACDAEVSMAWYVVNASRGVSKVITLGFPPGAKSCRIRRLAYGQSARSASVTIPRVRAMGSSV